MDETKPNKDRSTLRGLVSLSLAVAATWALFHYGVTDADLFLQYLKALSWPVVALLALVWLRDPLRERVANLLRLQAFGTELQFATATRQLASDLAGPVAGLAGDSPEDQPIDRDDTAVDSPRDQPIDNAGPAGDHTARVEGSIAEAEVSPAVDGPDWWHTVRAIADRVGMSDAELAMLDQRVTSDPQEAVEQVARAVDRLAVKYRSVRNANLHRAEEARDNIERVIRSSAEWGYQVGKSGSGPLVPDITWAEDGSWTITTQVPTRASSSVRVRKHSEVAHGLANVERTIKELEDEIKKIEREDSNPLRSSGLAGLRDHAWLLKLKDKLRQVDPSNPWAD